jgi:hypothetical protein
MVSSRGAAVRAAAVYALLSVVMTWPLITGLGRDVPWDLGDSILNIYILQWGCDQILSALHGNMVALTGYFHANFFYPEPLALAYSEHLLPQVLQALPLYALTGNAILVYGLLFLSTFALSGLGTFLFTRELTGSVRGAFVAGVVYAFAPYRIGQFSHLQVLSSQWMPFALYGLAVFFRTRRSSALAWTVVALWLNGLSCGYYLLYFPPFVALYALWEMYRRNSWREGRLWFHLTLAAVAFAACTLPFMIPYAYVRAQGFDARSIEEIASYAADTWAFFTAHSLNRVWGSVAHAFVRSEGELFPGLVPVLLTIAGLVTWLNHPGSGAASKEPVTAGAVARPRWRRVVMGIGGLVVLSQAATIGLMLAAGRGFTRVAGVRVRTSSIGRSLVLTAVAGAVMLALSPAGRRRFAAALRSPMALALAGMLLAWTLALGPRPTAGGHPLAESAPYLWLMKTVPGFDGLRVPARFAMVLALFMACGTACGAAWLDRWKRWGTLGAAVIVFALCLESTTVPMLINATSPRVDVVTPTGPLQIGDRTPLVYRAVAALPSSAVLVEFPFGVEDYDLRYMLASAVHRRPIVNGYSGGFPPAYGMARHVFGHVLSEPVRSLSLLRSTGITHTIVHEAIFLNGDGARLSAWLRSIGAREVGSFGNDRLFELPR